VFIPQTVGEIRKVVEGTVQGGHLLSLCDARSGQEQTVLHA